MENERARSKTLEILAGKGLVIPKSLPLLEEDQLRSTDEILDRLLCMTATAAVSYGFNRKNALTWLTQENLTSKLLVDEKKFIEGSIGNSKSFQIRIEGMWALAWAISIVDELDFWQDCDPQFVTILPNLRIYESSLRIRKSARLRSFTEVIAARDIAFCLHWILRDDILNNRPVSGGLKHYVVVERRRALDWMVRGEDWNDGDLDT